MRLLIAASLTAVLGASLLGCPRPIESQAEWRSVEGAPATRSLFSDEQKQRAEDVKQRAHINKMRAAFVSEEERACERDADCALTTLHCCGCATGGQLAGIHKEKVPTVLQRRGIICEQYICPQVISDHPSCVAEEAICQDGLCVPLLPASGRAPAGIGVEPIPYDEPPAAPGRE
jgi:hypothetical protein